MAEKIRSNTTRRRPAQIACLFTIDGLTMMNFLAPLQKCIFLVCSLVFAALGAVAGGQEPSADQVAFFEAKVRPLLSKHCYSCHSTDSDKVKGGLLLDSKEGSTAGGDSGDSIEPGNPDESLLMESVRYEDSGLQMPPKYQLSFP